MNTATAPQWFDADTWQQVTDTQSRYADQQPPAAEAEPEGRIGTASVHEPETFALTVPGVTNTCGQAAAASIIKCWGKNRHGSDEALMQHLCSKYPPDLFGGGAGTSPWRIIEMLKDHGLRAGSTFIEPWLPGGFMNPANQPAWHAHRHAVEESWINAGYPAIILADSGLVGHSQGWSAHWLVYHRSGGGQASLCNMFGANNHYIKGTLPSSKLHEAWEVRFLPVPLMRFHTILIQP